MWLVGMCRLDGVYSFYHLTLVSAKKNSAITLGYNCETSSCTKEQSSKRKRGHLNLDHNSVIILSILSEARIRFTK